MIFVRYVAPIFMAFVLVAGILDKYEDVALIAWLKNQFVDHGLLLILASGIIYYLKQIAESLSIQSNSSKIKEEGIKIEKS